MCLCALRRTDCPDLRASLSSWFQTPQTLVQALKSVCFIVVRGLHIVCFQEAFQSLVLSFQRPLKSCFRFAFLRVHCLTCCVASSPCPSLPTSLLSSLLSELVRQKIHIPFVWICGITGVFGRLSSGVHRQTRYCYIAMYFI